MRIPNSTTALYNTSLPNDSKSLFLFFFLLRFRSSGLFPFRINIWNYESYKAIGKITQRRRNATTHTWPQWDSNLWSQCSSGRRQYAPYFALILIGINPYVFLKSILGWCTLSAYARFSSTSWMHNICSVVNLLRKITLMIPNNFIYLWRAKCWIMFFYIAYNWYCSRSTNHY
jgi:hypothetical protein